jgi:hypothetical protein
MTPKIKMHGLIKPGFPVYLMAGGKAVTTDKKQSDPKFPYAIGQINKNRELKLNGMAEEALHLSE